MASASAVGSRWSGSFMPITSFIDPATFGFGMSIAMCFVIFGGVGRFGTVAGALS
jgi:hypothetical protein